MLLILLLLAVQICRPTPVDDDIWSVLHSIESADLEPARDEDGRYLPVHFTEAELNRTFVIHFNRGQLATKKFIEAIERIGLLNPYGVIVIATPDPDLVASHLTLPSVDGVMARAVYYRYEHFDKLFEGLPIKWIYSQEIYGVRRKWREIKLSDLARLALVYKYGGTYTDLDVVHQRLPEDRVSSLMVAETRKSINNAYFRFPRLAPILWETMVEIAARTLEVERMWGGFGPMLLTRVVDRDCGVLPLSSTGSVLPRTNANGECAGLVVLPVEALFPIQHHEAHLFAEPLEMVPPAVLERLARAQGIHWWYSSYAKRKGRTIDVDPDTLLCSLLTNSTAWRERVAQVQSRGSVVSRARM